MDRGEKESRKHGLALETLQRARDKWDDDRMKDLISLINGCVKRMKQKFTSVMVMKQCLSAIDYFQNEENLSLPDLIVKFLPSIDSSKNG